jgi:putative NADPH-quinone reductase
MVVSVILAHPNPKSFNHAIAHTAVDELRQLDHEVRFHDLYGEKFEPRLPFDELKEDITLQNDLERHCKEITEADGIVVVHPNWWGQPPAILKGWIDRVLRHGIAYRLIDDNRGENLIEGLLKADVAVVFNTADTPEERERMVFGDPLETLWKNCVLGPCGVEDVHRETFRVVVKSSDEQRHIWLGVVRGTMREVFETRND